MACSSAGSGVGRGCGGCRGRGGGRGSTDTVGQSKLDASHRENSDDVKFVVHVATWSGPWQGWGDVPKEDRDRLFEQFHKKWNAKIHSCLEKCIAGKFANMLSRDRNGATAMATIKGFTSWR
ncbi:hypothetical protein Hanom_Chr12g01141521 [Helianthus anomalus]